MISNNNRIHFNQQQTGSEFEERYQLPALTEGLTADKWYEIITSKGGRFTGGISFIPEQGIWFSINNSLQYQLVGNEWGLHLHKWVNNEWAQEVLTISGADGIEIYQNGGANGSGWNFKNTSVVKSDWSDVGSKTACIRMLRK